MKIKEWILVCLFLLCGSLYADNLKGVGKYRSEEGEKLSFIKSQLHYLAFRDIISQELEKIKLDPALFWNKYSEAFEKSFESIETNLKSRYGIESESTVPLKEGEAPPKKTLSPEKEKEFQKELRYKRLLALSRFGNLGKIFTSYQVERMTRSSRFTSNYHIELKANIDVKLLNELYLKYTREDSKTHYNTLYLQTDFTLQGLAWPDIGVEDATLFSKAVNEFWKKWLAEKMGTVVDSVEIVDESLRSRIGEYYRLTERAENVGDEFANALLLKIDSTIEKEYFRPSFNKLTYKLKTRVNLVDLKMQKIVYYDGLPLQAFTLTLGTPFETSSSVATSLSKFPISILNTLPQTVSTYEREAESFYIQVSGVRTVQDLIALKQKLEAKGITLGIQVEMNKYHSLQNSAHIIIHSRVSNQRLEDFFNHFNESEVERNFIAKTEVLSGQHLLKLDSLVDETAPANTEVSKEKL